jgi:hypothetical protein
MYRATSGLRPLPQISNVGRRRNNKAMLTSLSSSEVPLLINAKPQGNIVMKSYTKFSEAMATELFGEILAGSEDS